MLKLTNIVAVTASVAVVAGVGCSRQEVAGGSAPPVTTVQDASSEASTLPTPFTAEQIRDEWIVGFEVVMRRNGPDGESLERWRVVEADRETVSIEAAVIDALGEPIDEPQVARSGWSELRDHAEFPADLGSRVQDHRSTALGPLDGWLYMVQDLEGEGTTHFFFADLLPGAPVQVEAAIGDEVVTVLEQIERFRPESPDQG